MRTGSTLIVGLATILSSLAGGAAAAQTGLVTEAVEPGVVRVIGDGIRDLAPPKDDRDYQQAIGPDGSVWVWDSSGLIHLGDPASYPDAGTDRSGAGLEVAADGAPWAIADWRLERLDGQRWTVTRQAARGGVGAFDIAPDGTVWSAWLSNTGEAPYGGVGRLSDDGWTDHPLGSDLTTVLIGQGSGELEYLDLHSMRATADGQVWTTWSAQVAEADTGHPAALRWAGLGCGRSLGCRVVFEGRSPGHRRRRDAVGLSRDGRRPARPAPRSPGR